jgi:hypothetical protein
MLVAALSGKLTHLGRGNFLGGLVEDDALNTITNVPPIKYIGNIWQRYYHEAPSVGRERSLNTLLHRKEWHWIL